MEAVQNGLEAVILKFLVLPPLLLRYCCKFYSESPHPMKFVVANLVLMLCATAPVSAADSRMELRLSNALGAAAAETAVPIEFHSQAVLVYDQETGKPLLAKNADMQTPIASITKLMTAMLVLDAGQDMNERITISSRDRDTLKGTGSRLAIGASYTREQLLHLALIASDNRAAHALGRSYPGGVDRFVEMMNHKATQLGMAHTVYVEPTGLSSANRSTAFDLARLADHAYQHYPDIRKISSSGSYTLGKQRVVLMKRHRKPSVFFRTVAFNNTNRLTREGDWEIGLSKTGYIDEAGHCLVMQARVAQQNVIIVLLDALGKYSRIGDAARIKHWLESTPVHRAAVAAVGSSRT
jgi:serine-type D-Ala-D-Ala endopeptidase (penicillin-binding protein 7)